MACGESELFDLAAKGVACTMGQRKILVVEDDPAVREGLVDALTFEGYEIREAGTYEDAVSSGLATPFDLILLDLVLPGGDGLDVLKEIRAVRPAAPVIVLTARGQEEDRIQGLKLGADDYVQKPFSLRELLARVEAVLRRSSERPRDVQLLAVEGAEIDLSKHEIVLGDGTRRELTERESQLLAYFVQNPGRVISREELMRRVWGLSHTSLRTRTVDMHVARVRDKLPRPELIRTIRGRGYVFEAPA